MTEPNFASGTVWTGDNLDIMPSSPRAETGRGG